MVEIANPSSNTIKFRLKIQEHVKGEVNSILWGYDGKALLFSASKKMDFFNLIISYFLMMGSLIVVIGALIIKYGL